MKKKMNPILKTVLIVLLVLVLVVAAYAAYVFLDYHRMPDNVTLEVQNQLETVIPVEEPVTVASYNIGFGAYSDDYSFFMDGGKESRARSAEAVYENIGGAMKALQTIQPDLVLIQEVDENGTRSHHIDQRTLVTDAFPGYTAVYARNYDSPYLFWPLLEPHGKNQAGILTLSRYGITSSLRRSLPIENGPMKLVDLDRCYAVNRIPTDSGKELVLINFHLSAYTSDGKIAEEQLKMLFEDMQEEVEAGNYVIAGGDFNKDLLGNSDEIFGIPFGDATWAQPIPVELIPDSFSIVAPYDEANPVASCRNADRPFGPDDFMLTVDGFIVSDNVEVLSSRVIDEGFRWSDHNPVTMEVILQP